MIADTYVVFGRAESVSGKSSDMSRLRGARGGMELGAKSPPGYTSDV